MSLGAPTLFIACDAEDYDTATATCAEPYYTYPPSFVPYLSAEDGLLISAAIVGVWSIGAVFRVLVRTADWSK